MCYISRQIIISFLLFVTGICSIQSSDVIPYIRQFDRDNGKTDSSRSFFRQESLRQKSREIRKVFQQYHSKEQTLANVKARLSREESGLTEGIIQYLFRIDYTEAVVLAEKIVDIDPQCSSPFLNALALRASAQEPEEAILQLYCLVDTYEKPIMDENGRYKDRFDVSAADYNKAMAVRRAFERVVRSLPQVDYDILKEAITQEALQNSVDVDMLIRIIEEGKINGPGILWIGVGENDFISPWLSPERFSLGGYPFCPQKLSLKRDQSKLIELLHSKVSLTVSQNTDIDILYKQIPGSKIPPELIRADMKRRKSSNEMVRMLTYAEALANIDVTGGLKKEELLSVLKKWQEYKGPQVDWQLFDPIEIDGNVTDLYALTKGLAKIISCDRNKAVAILKEVVESGHPLDAQDQAFLWLSFARSYGGNMREMEEMMRQVNQYISWKALPGLETPLGVPLISPYI